ncbi:MAG: SRPBCC family protein [Chloroflexota bacterium]
MTERDNSVTQATKRELVITRVINAPRKVVFKAWTDPKQVTQWWGPFGFTIPVCEMDFRSGGSFLIHMRGPDGVVYPDKGIFDEIVEPERLVFTDSAIEDESGNPHLVVHTTVTFADQGGKTKLTLRAVVVKATPEAEGALSGMEAGWAQSLAKLAELLSTSRVTPKAASWEIPGE